MAILDVTTQAKVTAIVELDRLMDVKLNLYSGFIGVTPSQVVNTALGLVFREDDSFQHFLIGERAERIHSLLQQHAIREVQMRDEEFRKFLASDPDRSDDNHERKLRLGRQTERRSASVRVRPALPGKRVSKRIAKALAATGAVKAIRDSNSVERRVSRGSVNKQSA